jgi:hypothetical protein
MTVVTIQTEDTNLLLRLREWLKQNAPTAKVQENEVQINWTDATLDAESEALVKDTIARRKAGDRSHLADIQSIKEVFYDL